MPAAAIHDQGLHLICFIFFCYVPTDSEDPQPAAASRKGRRKKTEIEAAEAAAAAEAEAAAAELAAAGGDAALTNWLDTGGSAEEDRRRFPYHRCAWQQLQQPSCMYMEPGIFCTHSIKAAAGNAAMMLLYSCYGEHTASPMGRCVPTAQ
jgi:hypothetical protein